MKLKNYLKSLMCTHSNELIFVRNIHGDEINLLNARSIWICPDCNKVIYWDQLHDAGEISDGYHTFNELYHHRAILTAVICNMYKEFSWKSLLHHDGTMYDGMFIVGINTPTGTATYHYDVDKYWDIFNVPEISNAPEWDGHTSDDAIKRIYSLIDYKRNMDNKDRFNTDKKIIHKHVRRFFCNKLK